ncbi:uncharacterized protein LOC62_07G009499 [Vanrija pseudolonga]|uniref:Uncharacterized protein n=1 Tax=Vanrija pseudolonga TaxID=143232 RepID=A0AAF0YKG4_9TREE|nr:hypothetical protein LOC62_07G009499 [Vanrija pseudolonga]
MRGRLPESHGRGYHTPRAFNHDDVADLDPAHRASTSRRNPLPPLPDPTGGLTRGEHASAREQYLDSLGPLDSRLPPLAPAPTHPHAAAELQ